MKALNASHLISAAAFRRAKYSNTPPQVELAGNMCIHFNLRNIHNIFVYMW